jgi:hypothetical protein
MMELMKGLPENVIGITGSGTITAEDYDTILIPAIHEKLKKYKKIRILYQLDTSYVHSVLR